MQSQTVSPIPHDKFNECGKHMVLGTTRSGKKKKVPGHDFMLRPVGRCGEEVRGGSEEEEEGTGSRKA